jgi:predicted phage tail protein
MKMMQCCFLILVFLAASTIAFGSPFLVSDPYRNKDAKLTKFLVTINGKTSESMPVKNSEGHFYLKYDLGSLPDGTYTAEVKSVDTKGKESSPASCSFKKTGTKVEPYTPPVPKQKIAPSRRLR